MEGIFPGPFLASASSEPALTEKPEASATLFGPEQAAVMKPRHKMYPKEKWLSLQPIIQQLYVDEGWTFREVAEYLRQHHDFNPT
jgi:hypothetical protein